MLPSPKLCSPCPSSGATSAMISSEESRGVRGPAIVSVKIDWSRIVTSSSASRSPRRRPLIKAFEPIVKLKAPEANIIIEPDVSHLESFEFYRGKEAIEAGYKAAIKSIPQISKHILK